MFHVQFRKIATIAGVATVAAGALFVTSADATKVSGTSQFKMISNLSRVRECSTLDLTSKATATWSVDRATGNIAVAFGGATRATCISIFRGAGSSAKADISYQTVTGTVLTTRTVSCANASALPVAHCPFPSGTSFSNAALNKVVVTLTQTAPAAAPATTTLTVPSTLTDTDSFKMISGLSRVRSCAIADITSKAKLDWTYRSTGLNSVRMSGSDHVCLSLLRPGDSDAKVVVTYKNAAGTTLSSKTITCHDTALVLIVNCPFPTTTEKTLPGLQSVSIALTQTNPAAGTATTLLDLGD